MYPRFPVTPAAKGAAQPGAHQQAFPLDIQRPFTPESARQQDGVLFTSAASSFPIPTAFEHPSATATMSGNGANTPGTQPPQQVLTSVTTVYVTLTNSTAATATQPTSSGGFSTYTQTLTSFVVPSAVPYPTAATPTVTFASLPTTNPMPPYTFSRPQATATVLQDQAQGRTGNIAHPNAEQSKTIWVAAVMLVSLLLGWNMILLRDALYPWKMWINTVHEGCHILVGTLTGARIISVTIDPDKGPITGMTEGQPLITLLAGYTGSILIGSALIMCAFDTSASKVAALIVYPVLLVCFWFGRTWARLRVLVCMAVSVAFFFINHASALRFYVLFLGVMNAFYVLWDVVDDQIFRKANESDVALLARISPPTIHLWILLWLVLTLTFVSLAIIGGLYFFNKSAEAQMAAQKSFLWT